MQISRSALVVIELDPEVDREAQRRVLVSVKADEQPPGWDLTDHTTFADLDPGCRIGRVSELDDLLVAGRDPDQLGRAEALQASLADVSNEHRKRENAEREVTFRELAMNSSRGLRTCTGRSRQRCRTTGSC